MALAEFGGRPVSLSPGKSLGADSILTGGTEIEKSSFKLTDCVHTPQTKFQLSKSHILMKLE